MNFVKLKKITAFQKQSLHMLMFLHLKFINRLGGPCCLCFLTSLVSEEHAKCFMPQI